MERSLRRSTQTQLQQYDDMLLTPYDFDQLIPERILNKSKHELLILIGNLRFTLESSCQEWKGRHPNDPQDSTEYNAFGLIRQLDHIQGLLNEPQLTPAEQAQYLFSARQELVQLTPVVGRALRDHTDTPGATILHKFYEHGVRLEDYVVRPNDVLASLMDVLNKDLYGNFAAFEEWAAKLRTLYTRLDHMEITYVSDHVIVQNPAHGLHTIPYVEVVRETIKDLLAEHGEVQHWITHLTHIQHTWLETVLAPLIHSHTGHILADVLHTLPVADTIKEHAHALFHRLLTLFPQSIWRFSVPIEKAREDQQVLPGSLQDLLIKAAITGAHEIGERIKHWFEEGAEINTVAGHSPFAVVSDAVDAGLGIAHVGSLIEGRLEAAVLRRLGLSTEHG